ncbi:MAG: hypothetical protein A3A43_03030 [Candidatus Liptonbacteria bacterium RIFCSPLOWO2_01_FULL_56_20]|uniref:DUF8128 domain-containing protein n=1 Tax=Candidatus Liptonbacteria bacterium RIFCSPLOWO2_01_FULL_56_20 TaxID=1798652 RepID=A0A1G2CIH2_9BACT|nr:MAG: hypothetical protein A2681_00160 [Candidatus Liptonbacteria bacterium RIFCSPHIGHO2_01_FULL_56_18b]OGZ01017.1 MAG: hypothetical protein A3A43_03030 [Candidatus Liptonbacteria bacterium RIFCSPLOWO2_01_FULL_56_20]
MNLEVAAAISPFLRFLALTWWLWAFFILFPIARSAWLAWRQFDYKHSGEFKGLVLELRIPREIRKSPRAMEQVLMALHSLRNAPGDLRERWWDGEVTKWFSLELVSIGGEIHFYIRLPYHKQRNLVEAAFFSYYPDVEIEEVDDYVDRFPENVNAMYAKGYDMWGTEMVLTREAAFPIKTFYAFESPDEEKQYDPISAFLEVLGKVRTEEVVGIQMLIAPSNFDWYKKWFPFVEKLKQTKGAEEARKLKHAWEFPEGPLPVINPVKPGKDEFGAFKSLMRTPGETDILKAVEGNLSKPAFDTLIRFIYVSPKKIYYDSFARRGLVGAFKQYSALNLNDFLQNFAMSTRTRIWNWPHVAPKTRNEYRKERLLLNYRTREVPEETFMGKLLTSHFFNWNFSSRRFEMNVECLATLFHPPTFIVLTAPHIKRVESRKAGPPAGLAIFGEEREIEKYQ